MKIESLQSIKNPYTQIYPIKITLRLEKYSNIKRSFSFLCSAFEVRDKISVRVVFFFSGINLF